MVLEAGTSVRNVETDLHSSYMSMTMESQSTIMWAALAPSFIDASLVINSLCQNSTFVDFLKRLIRDDDLVNHLCMAYQLGATSMREAIFLEIDYNLRIRTGKS